MNRADCHAVKGRISLCLDPYNVRTFASVTRDSRVVHRAGWLRVEDGDRAEQPHEGQQV